MALVFWGRKSKVYMQEILKLYPAEKVDIIIDACMGSGSFSKHVACKIVGVQRQAFEIDRSLAKMHQVIKENASELISQMLECQFSEELYLKSRKVTREYNLGSGEYKDIDIAFAELILLYYSYNGMRGNVPRRFDSYLKYDDARKYNQSKKRLESMKTRFQLRAPGDIYDLSDCWQDLKIVNDSFLNHTELWKNPRAWIYIDTPYELHKRGVYGAKAKEGSHWGYDYDMSQEEHEQFIESIIQFSDKKQLKAKMMICTNYEVNDKGEILIPSGDLYSRLIVCGFKRVFIENKACSNTYISTANKDEGARRKRHRKVETVYINYETLA